MHPTTLITGASKRIGAAIARHLAARGHDLVLHYRHSRVEVEALAGELRAAHGVAVTCFAANLADLDTLPACLSGLPPITNIIHNAARFTRDTLATMTADALRDHLTINLAAPLLLTQAYLAQLPADSFGRILVLGDGCKGASISPAFFSYAVSKLGWESVIGLLAAAAAPRATANVIALGPTLEGATDPAGMYDRLAARAPLKHNSSVASVLATIDFLLAADDITGQVISLAGGAGIGLLKSAV